MTLGRRVSLYWAPYKIVTHYRRVERSEVIYSP